jgi:excisionase family DNA binding protein
MANKTSTVTKFPKAAGVANPKGHLRKRLYSVGEAAEYMGRSVNGLREMQWAGKLPYIKDGKKILFDIIDLDKWIEQNKIVDRY